MVHLDKTEGQKGSMVLTEYGSIISSTGDLASSESTAHTIMALVSHSLQLDFNSSGNNVAPSENNAQNGYTNNVIDAEGNVPQLCTKWNRLTVSFGDHSYVACMSNKKIHVVKRDESLLSEPAAAATSQVHDIDQ